LIVLSNAGQGTMNMPLTLSDVLADVPDAVVTGDATTLVRGLSFDSRTVQPGWLFVALRGGYTDGHLFLEDALAAGAHTALVERGAAAGIVCGFRAIAETDDSRAALARVAASFFGYPSRAMTVVGITGTDGKTTTSYFVESICRAAGQQTGMIGTVEIRIAGMDDLHESRQTTPESLHVQDYLHRMQQAGVHTAVIEATSHGLELHRLDGCDFDVGVVTNITHEHLDFHGSVANYRAAKGGLFRRVAEARARGKRGVVVVNLDDEGARSIEPFAGDARIVRYSLDGHPHADVSAAALALRADGSSFVIDCAGTRRDVTLHLPGRYNIANALAAAATGVALDLQPDILVEGLQTLRAVPGRMESIQEGQPFGVIVDYAHSPEAIRNVLAEVRRLATGRVIVVFGSAGERDIEKRGVQGRVAIEAADFAVFTSEDPRYEDPEAIIADIAEGAERAGGKLGVDFECIEDRRQAIASALSKAAPGDVVMLAGKGHERSMIYGSDKRPWNEAEEARRALRFLGYSSSSEADRSPA
jgi:UDP-N-acetylmuramoyl-L-alanyl-D-glutamate--2,6-diaminopimelate ligase